MKNIYTKISINIIVMFSIAILMSIVPDLFPNYFGDWKCQGNEYIKIGDGRWANNELNGCLYLDNDHHNPTWHWGWRHWLWFLMGLSLFIIQFVKIIFMMVKYTNKDEKS